MLFDMIKLQDIFFRRFGVLSFFSCSLFILLALAPIPSKSIAQTLGVLCMNSSTKTITVEKACTRSQVRLSGANMPSAPFINSKCYTQKGQASDGSYNGKVAVALSCRTGDVVVSDSFDTSDATRANPKLSAKTLIFTGSLKGATGVQFETQGEANKFYSLSATILCCPGS
jgi:hypothetical protein